MRFFFIEFKQQFSTLWNNRQLKSSITWMSWIIMHFDKESECLSNDFWLLEQSTWWYVIKEPIFGPSLFSNNMDQYCGCLDIYMIHLHMQYNNILLVVKSYFPYKFPHNQESKKIIQLAVSLTDIVLGWVHSKCIMHSLLANKQWAMVSFDGPRTWKEMFMITGRPKSFFFGDP